MVERKIGLSSDKDEDGERETNYFALLCFALPCHTTCLLFFWLQLWLAYLLLYKTGQKKREDTEGLLFASQIGSIHQLSVLPFSAISLITASLANYPDTGYLPRLSGTHLLYGPLVHIHPV